MVQLDIRNAPFETLHLDHHIIELAVHNLLLLPDDTPVLVSMSVGKYVI